MPSTACRLLAVSVLLAGCGPVAPAAPPPPPPRLAESTPSLSHYDTWLSNTDEGAGEAQTLANLAFFQWLHDEYGMSLDLYVMDAGNIDGGENRYGSPASEKFRRQFPRGFGPIAEQARALGCRLGMWLGPDGFGQTPEEEAARREMVVGLCRDFGVGLLKFDSYCGNLRPSRRDAFIRMLQECRAVRPDLLVLQHRLELGHAAPYTSAWLWEGAENYIDVHTVNTTAATHHRAGSLARGLPPNMTRLCQDGGLCLSSCLDYWEDDLVLQAFNRCPITAPDIYGNPWLLRDDEYPRLARLVNLHRRYRDILVNGMTLPEAQYGPFAVSRGDGATRFVTLRNLTWEPVRYRVRLDGSIGLTERDMVELRRFHPSESILGVYPVGSMVPVDVPPFRSCLLMASTRPVREIGIEGCDYEVLRDVPGKSVSIRLLGEPGTSAMITFSAGGRSFKQAILDGRAFSAEGLVKRTDGSYRRGGESVEFPGPAYRHPWHRKLDDLKPCDVPSDAEALYEATCFAADNDALEVRSLRRSGPTTIPAVQRARDAFFGRKMLAERGAWDRFAFDGDRATSFDICRRIDKWDPAIRGGMFRIDCGGPVPVDRLLIRLKRAVRPQRLAPGRIAASGSADLTDWRPIDAEFVPADGGAFATDSGPDGPVKLALPPGVPIRYIRIEAALERVSEVRSGGSMPDLDCSRWRASNLFGSYAKSPAVAAWTCSFTLGEAPPGSYLAIPLHGKHGVEGAYAALRVDGKPVGAPDRAVSYPSNVWEYRNVDSDSNYTYFFPVTPDMVGKKIDVVALVLKDGVNGIKPEAWITAYPVPYGSRQLELTGNDQ